MQIIYLVVAAFCLSVTQCGSPRQIFKKATENPESWTGRWLPDRETTTAEVISQGENTIVRGMGNRDLCDDGETNLNTDWKGYSGDHLCLNPRNRISINVDIEPLIEFENIPRAYQAEHRCMNESITYLSQVPTFGAHRQLWPVFGDYKFLPAQRWLHTLEHGGVAVLYHPCADPSEIGLLKKSVKRCLRRYIITPWRHLPENRPLALVAWGVRLRLSRVSPQLVMSFIEQHALNGPEHISKDGQFDKLLVSRAEVISDVDDSNLCPFALAHD